TGAAGANGAPGATGASGATGPAGAFSGTFTSPNGQYSLSVTDAGITLSGSGTVIALGGNGVRIDTPTFTLMSQQGTRIATGEDLQINTGTSASIRSGAATTIDSGGSTTVKGAVVFVGGGSCAQAIRRIDTAEVFVPSVPGTYPVQFTSGSADVLLC
ncbi:MAG TPA: hypothetical protein VJQ09_03835, partial [Candidatus Limnocylindria bacterium]|nr:hypothetical protein [Candidatus Limnocylindria bacterium]